MYEYVDGKGNMKIVKKIVFVRIINMTNKKKHNNRGNYMISCVWCIPRIDSPYLGANLHKKKRCNCRLLAIKHNLWEFR